MTAGRRLPPSPGSYVLVLRNQVKKTLNIGRLGPCEFSRAWYLYTGSAFGPGGLAARVGRHLRPDKPCRWHIDYLTTGGLAVHRIWLSTTPKKLECVWAALLARMGGDTVPGFGASDCSCAGHLFRFQARPSFQVFREGTPWPVRSVNPASQL